MTVPKKKSVAKREPVALIGAIGVVVVSGLAYFGVVLETATVETLVMDGILVVGAFGARTQVSPKK